MFSKLTEQVRRNTALDLTLRFALLFLLSAAVLFVTVDYLLARSQLEKDQQLIDSFVESYQRLEAQAGLHKLELVIERDSAYLQRSAMRVELLEGDGSSRLLVQPPGWGMLQPPTDQVVNNDWRKAGLSDGKTQLLYREVRLPSGLLLRIGQSDEPRQAQLASYRGLVLQVMLPLFLLALLLTAWMNWRALRPVHDLISTVRSLRARELSARVTVRNPGSELGELARLFNDMLARIERLITGMQQSLDSVAHDLRTPLSRMRLSLESAISRPDDARIREALMDCAEENERIERMLKTLMDISEAESGILRLHPESLDLRELAEECLELYRYVAEDKQISLSLEADGDCRLLADRVRIGQVLGNLLDNAIKYTPVGGQVGLSLARQGNRLLLQVKDTGAGIGLADQAHVFERLYRADASRTEPGMGLGLCLVRAVVDAHRGVTELSSVPGQGSCFSVTLPVVRED